MTDNRLRKASRGEYDESRARYLAELVRAGRLERSAVVLAAQAGYKPARLLEDVEQIPGSNLEKLLASLEAIRGRTALLLLACDFLEKTLKTVPLSGFFFLEGEKRPTECIDIVRRFLVGQATSEELRTAVLDAPSMAIAMVAAQMLHVLVRLARGDSVPSFEGAPEACAWIARRSMWIEGHKRSPWQRKQFLKYVLGDI